MFNIQKVFASIFSCAVFSMGFVNVADAQLPPLQNPYCAIPTFVYNNIPYRALSTMVQTPNGPVPIIYISTAFVGNPSLLQFAIAHECGHQLLGHIIFNATNPNAQMFRPQEEYQADCWAAQRMKADGNWQAIQAALIDAGPIPSMDLPNRVPNIQACAAG